MNKYQPRFKPEDYLKLLNKNSFLFIYNSRVGKPVLEIYGMTESGTSYRRSRHQEKSIEECLDQAILTIGFEKEL
jgi:hypothetical protein